VLDKKFDKIFCINLDRRPDRWENVQKEFEKIGVENYERFSAIDGNDIKFNNHLLTGELGCLLSHLEITKKARELGLKNYLVIEDDIEFIRGFNKLFDSFYSQVPQDWNMIYLGGNTVVDRPLKITDNVYKIHNTYTTHAIVVKDTMYDVIIETLPKMKKQVDVYYADFQKSFNCYCSMNPKLIWQVDGKSDIQNVEVKYPFLR
jgi:glycosyl transferase family 25